MIGSVTAVALGELALLPPPATHAQPAHAKSHAPIKAKLASVGSPCGLGSIGADNGWSMPLPAAYMVNGSVDQGVDYAAPGGTPECAMGDGTIIREGAQTIDGLGPGALDGFGPWAPALQIDDGPLAGQTVYYGHAGPDLVPVGAHVASGQQITEVGYGIVGLSTGPHIEIGFYPPGPFGAGQAMLNYINAAGPNDNSSCTVWGGHQVCGAIRDKYLSLGGGFVLGVPLTDESTTPDGVGRYNHFSNGWSIYWTPFTGAQSIHGAIRDLWAAMGWERSILGYPITDETGTPDGIGRYNHFSLAGSIYWTQVTGAHEVHGAIRAKWAAMGWEASVLGYPTTNESTTPDGIGRYNHFSDDGSIYWTPNMGAFSIHGAIRDHWAAMGWERSVLGYPATDETGTPDGVGRFNHFSSIDQPWAVDGSIYFTNNMGAFSIHGAIRAEWASLGYERSFLGYPATDEWPTPDGVGRFNHFSSIDQPWAVDGSIYWTPTTGAHEVHGAIRAEWASLGYERSCLGYPTGDETGIPGGRESTFQHGNITYSFSMRVASVRC
jgi:uncharacterized protein with LGFP repeats